MSTRTTITRRDFLKSTAISTAAIMVGATESDEIVENSIRLTTGWEHHLGSLGGPWDAWRADQGNKVVWQPVQIPHCFNARDSVDPDTPFYEGPGWYRTRLKLANPFPNGRALLHFEGAGQASQIFVYLEEAGRHLGGYDEFIIDMTEPAARALKNPSLKGEVPVVVLCDNSRDPEMIPSSLNDFCRYGGLYRHVNLVYMPAISIERIHVDSTIQPGRPVKISVKGQLYNPGTLNDNVEIRIRIFDPAGSIIHTSTQIRAPWTGERELSAFETNLPKLWSPAKPSLYRCEAKLTSRHGSMTATEHFGLRYFEFVAHGPFKLNGERLVLRGTQRHEDHAGVAAAMSDEVIRAEMKLIKETGANFIRLGHAQQSRSVLALCDELGLLVWEEIPWSRGGLGGERYRQQARNMLRAMIDQHYNHPAIIIWGLGNELDWPGDFPEFDKDKIRAFVSELNKIAHTIDPARKTALRRCDFAKDSVDVYAPSIWAGWYQGKYTDYKDRCQKEMEQVDHMIHVEWGGDSHARRHSEDTERLIAKVVGGRTDAPQGLDYLLTGGQDHAATDGDWSESYICNLFDWHLKEQETMPWLTGAAQWVFKDFATPLRPENPVPYVNQKGMVERDLTLKESYYVFQSYWAENPMVHIYGHSWPVRWGEPGEQKLIKVYSNCDTAELFLNGESQGSRKRNSQDFPAAGLRWLAKCRSGENQVRVEASKNGRRVADEIRFQYQTEKWSKPASLELRKKTETKRDLTIEVLLLDSRNILCLDARNVVRFGVTGDGTLLDNLGTSTGSRVLQLYNGRAEITLQTKSGKSVLSASSPGLPTAFLSLGVL
ncbi:MAG TPA: glycoside hydrolase family 2 TIM barrel-domain containing protein [Candidatus Angelobacter sp.]|jgi:beta-galactosidase|nr:glycoside hydrolase family 2 TIM barrel-domain containing protein [Candidatus Angelobacter sp.]